MNNSLPHDWPALDEGPTAKRAAGILIMTRRRPNQFLLMRHVDRWDLPKGHSEPGESVVETALRETEEETGISGQDIEIDPDFCFQLVYPVRYKKRDNQPFRKQVVYLLGKIDDPVTPDLTEHLSFQWFDWSPPHQIQEQTIDPLLDAVRRHLESS
ncbi:NUDIX domain-containing protein [Roseiconus nitratireducens]|uniref:Bis(5'-nucleosyl)-tetraphosphatase [asymmetrical] n=1 Tax=Roseiconus nitratireducens TaxID=2605748 RepID=A0A5M6DDR8_9BACT|nr:NUDIX domain-containing protein [Roseiconus nitratireducens]KAA5544586.1 NUDIX domain-containing protein [Roseiconus nitratireducens]